jgi:hypothetical protein
MFWKKKISKPIVVNVIDKDYIKNFVYQWNLSYPIDRWWRNKHKIAFNSPEHRAVSFFDMRFEFDEDELFNKEYKNYVPDIDDWLDVDKDDEFLTDEQKLDKYKKEFKDLDLSQYDD